MTLLKTTKALYIQMFTAIVFKLVTPRRQDQYGKNLTVAKHLALASLCSGVQSSGEILKLLGVAPPNVSLISGFFLKF